MNEEHTPQTNVGTAPSYRTVLALIEPGGLAARGQAQRDFGEWCTAFAGLQSNRTSNNTPTSRRAAKQKAPGECPGLFISPGVIAL